MRIRDKVTALMGVTLLLTLVASSTYYAVRTDIEALRTEKHRESPDFVTRDVVVTNFNADGTAKDRLFASYAEHYSDGRSTTIKPKVVTLRADTPQMTASANTGTSMDDAETAVLTGNVVLTRAGDRQQAALRVTTPHATVHLDEQVVTTDAPVRVESGADTMTGMGMRFDAVDRTIDLQSDVHTVIYPETFRRKR